MIPGPTKAAVLSCSVAGADFTARVLKISIFETICKPYLTGTLVIRDDNNVINNLDLKGGEPCSFNVSAGDGLNYTMTLYLLKMQGEPMNNNLRSIKYTMDLIGPEYFGDRANMVQQSFNNMTGTAIAQAIQSRFLGSSLVVPIASMGIFGEKNNHVVSSVKPFKAINDVRKLMSFGGSASGASVYYRDRYQVNLTKLEYLFSSMGSQYTFNQKNTWGSDWHNVLGAYDAVLAASTSLNKQQGAGGVQQIAVANQFERKVRDMFSTKKPYSDDISSGISSIMSAVTGGHGGLQNFPIFDSTKLQKENVRNTGAEAAYQAQIVDGPQVTIKVPLQTGILCTVGKGCTVNLIAPSGDYSAGFSRDRTSGNKLVVDCCHTVEVSTQGMLGTTTMRLATPPGG